ncbi:MAG: hypothetical protein AAF907_07185 [Planctomycetota bacterium]
MPLFGQKPRTFDLRSEAEAFRTDLRRRFTAFDPASPDGPGEGGPVTLWSVGFDLNEEGWIAVVFDTRPDAEHDAEWTDHVHGAAKLPRPAWYDVSDHLDEGGAVTVIGLDGAETTVRDNCDRLLEPVGDMLSAVVNEERVAGALPDWLPAGPDACIVEAENGGY